MPFGFCRVRCYGGTSQLEKVLPLLSNGRGGDAAFGYQRIELLLQHPQLLLCIHTVDFHGGSARMVSITKLNINAKSGVNRRNRQSLCGVSEINGCDKGHVSLLPSIHVRAATYQLPASCIPLFFEYGFTFT